MTDERAMGPAEEPTKAELVEQAQQAEVRTSGTKAEIRDEIASSEFFGGYWKGRPNFKCPQCPFASIAGVRAVREHIAGMHPARTRVSGLVGSDGKPITVREE
jgi:hypothetical protein